MSVARYVGLTDSAAWVEQVGSRRVYIVERYDRPVRSHGVVDRLHQEDLCQALGVRPAEKYNVGRPSQRIARVLRTFSDDPETDLTALLRHVTFRAVVGDQDGHARNVSLMLDEGRVRLAPLYDSLCTLSYSELDGKMGAGIGNQVSLFKVSRQALVEEGKALGLPPGTAREVVDDIAERIRESLARLGSLDLEERAVASVTEISRHRVANLLDDQPMGAPPSRTVLDAPGRGPTGTTRNGRAIRNNAGYLN